MKEKRIESLKEIMEKIVDIQDHYVAATSGWTLLQAAWGHVMSLHHLESKTHFCDQTLGVKDE